MGFKTTDLSNYSKKTGGFIKKGLKFINKYSDTLNGLGDLLETQDSSKITKLFSQAYTDYMTVKPQQQTISETKI